MNSYVVRLLQDKLLPLRREKYNHLQKINLALRNNNNLLKTEPSKTLHRVILERLN
jgi:hypothetical protein